jgi:magnesium transporter
MEIFTKHYHPPGTTPGSLQAHPQRIEQLLSIRLVRYDKETIDVSEVNDFNATVSTSDGTGQRLTWLHVQGHPSGEMLTSIGEYFALHPLALEDVHNTGQRSKVEEYDNRIFIILSLPHFDDGVVTVDQASFFLGPDFVLSFCDGKLDPFGPVLQRLQLSAGKLRSRGSDYLLYALMDTVIDQGFPVLEAFGFELENVEERVVSDARRETLIRIHTVKRDLILLRRMLWPQREVISSLIQTESELVADGTRIYLRDCYEHTIHIMDLLEAYRDMSVSLLDIYLSSISNRMNEIMRVLTVIATIFIPLTFIVGVYGMNFDGSPWAMPELHWYFGYPLIWLIMILIAIGMLIYFRRRRWL